MKKKILGQLIYFYVPQNVSHSFFPYCPLRVPDDQSAFFLIASSTIILKQLVKISLSPNWLQSNIFTLHETSYYLKSIPVFYFYCYYRN